MTGPATIARVMEVSVHRERGKLTTDVCATTNGISRTLREARPPRSGLVQRFGDEPRVLFASASIALFGVLRHTSLGA
jgi:hypothetical protein